VVDRIFHSTFGGYFFCKLQKYILDIYFKNLVQLY